MNKFLFQRENKIPNEFAKPPPYESSVRKTTHDHSIKKGSDMRMNGTKTKKKIPKRLVSGLMAMTLTFSTLSGTLEGGFEKIHLGNVAENISQLVSDTSINASAAATAYSLKIVSDKKDQSKDGGFEHHYLIGSKDIPDDMAIYCLNYGAKSKGSKVIEVQSGYGESILTDDEKKAIGLIGYYGYPNLYPNDGYATDKTSETGIDVFDACQSLVWEVAEGKRSLSASGFTNQSDYYSHCDTDAKKQYDNVLKRVQRHFAVSPYAGQTITLKYNPTTRKYEGTIKVASMDNKTAAGTNSWTDYGTDLYTKLTSSLDMKVTKNGTTWTLSRDKPFTNNTHVTTVNKKFRKPQSSVSFHEYYPCTTDNLKVRRLGWQSFALSTDIPDVSWKVTFKTEDSGFGAFEADKKWIVDGNPITDTSKLLTWNAAVRYRLKVLGSQNGAQYVHVAEQGTSGSGNYTFQKFGKDSKTYTRGEGPNTLMPNKSTGKITVSGLPAGYTYLLEEVVRGDGGYDYQTDKTGTKSPIPKSTFESAYKDFYDPKGKLGWSSESARIGTNKFGDDVLSHKTIVVGKGSTINGNTVEIKNSRNDVASIVGRAYKEWDGQLIPNNVSNLNNSVYFVAYINANLGSGVKKYYLRNNAKNESGTSDAAIYAPINTTGGQINANYWTTNINNAMPLKMRNPSKGITVEDVPNKYNNNYWNTSVSERKIYFEEYYESNPSTRDVYTYQKDTGIHYGDTTFENLSRIIKFRLEKFYTSSNSSYPVEGAVYELYKTSSDFPTSPVPETGYVPRSTDELWYTGTTASNGCIYVPNELSISYEDAMEYNWFWVEKTAPNGFQFDQSIHKVNFSTFEELTETKANILFSDTGFTTRVTETKKSASLTIEKKNDLGDPVSGISFDIILDMPAEDVDGNALTYKFDTPVPSGYSGHDKYYYNGTKANGDVLATITTNSSGIATISNLPTAYCNELDDFILQVKIVETTKASPYVVADEDKTVLFKASDSTDATLAYIPIKETVLNKVQRGRIEISKTDKLTGEPLEGAVFEITAAEEFKIGNKVVHEKGAVIATLTTDEDGKAYTYKENEDISVDAIPLYVGAKYLIKEIKAPEGYQLSDETKTVEFEWDDTKGMYYHDFREVEFEDERKTVSVDVHKHEEGTGYNEWLGGAQFELRAYDPVTIEMPNGTKKSFTKGQVIGYAETIESTDNTIAGRSKFYDKKENIRIDEHEVKIPVGFKYQIVETKAPAEYKLDPTPEVFTVEAGENASVVIVRMYDARAGVKVGIKKVDKNNNEILIPNAEFTVYADEDMELLDETPVSKGDVVTTLITGEDGTATSEKTLPAGKKFIVKETKAPEGYLLDEANTASFTTIADETTEIPVMTFNFDETVQPLTVNVLKIDKDMKDKFNSNHPLANAEISIYANEDNVISYDGETTYKKGDLIQTVTTAADGKATFDKVRSGYDYYIKETKAPTGYELNDTVIEIPNTYDPTKDSITVNHTIINTYHNVEVNIIKKSTDGDLPVEGAEFTLYADENIYYADGTTLMWAKDAAIAVATTDTRGKATFPVEIPVGYKYHVEETGVPANYVKVSGDNWTFTLAKDYTDDKISKTVYNKWQDGEITVLKLDGEDGTPLANAEFDLIAAEDITRGENHYSEGDVIASVKTGDDGTATFDVRVPVGFRYTVKETKAPEGYVNAEGVSETFELGYDAAVEYVSVTKTFNNDYQKGIINVIKKDSETGTYLNGAEFALYADEDVRLASGSILYSKGQEIERFKTGDTMADGTSETGVIKFGVKDDGTGKLPVNYSYRIKETVPPANYVKSDFEQVITLEYSATVEYVSATTSVDNDYQQGSIKVFKTDGKTTRKLADAKFTLYADEDVKLADGTIKYAKGTAIETIITNTDGEATFTKVPVGFKYKVVEAEAPKGYKNKHPEQVIDLAYDVNVEFVEETVSVENTPNEIYFSKKKLADNKELSGATMEVRNSTTNELIDTWVSDGTDHLIERIPAGSYNFIEKAAPNGYVIATTIPFTIDEEGNVTSGTVTVESKDVDGKVHPLITMLDDATKVDIYKVDKNEFESGNSANLAGAKLQLFDGNTLIEEWTTTTEAHRFDAVLTAGKTYRIHEAEPPAGYVLRTDDVTFTVGTNGQRQNVYVENEEVELHVSKKDITNGEELPNAELKVTNKETGEIIDSWTSSDEAHVIHKIPAGTYILTETGAPEGYLISNEVEFTVDNLNRVQHVEMVDDVNKIDVFKLDRDTEAKVAGAKLKLTATKAGSKLDISDVIVTAPTGKESTVVREDNTITWVSGADACTFKRLPNGEYEISEIEAPESYAVATGAVKFKVVDNKVVNAENASITSVNFYNGKSKVNIIKSYKFMIAPAAAGAEFTLTSDVDVDWTALTLTGLVDVSYNGSREMTFKSETPSADGDFTMSIVGLPNGNYTVTETGVPEGFVGDDTVYNFSIEDGYFVFNGVRYDGADEGSINIENDYSEFSVAKVDDNGTALAGAVLALYDENENEIARWTTDGTVKTFKALPYGTYTVKELKAPNRYNTAKPVVIEHNGEVNGVTYNVVNYHGIVMPQTGGNGLTNVLTFIGTLLTSLSVLYYTLRRKREF